MKKLSDNDIATAQKYADFLDKQHSSHASQRKLGKNFNFKGLCGELHFADEFSMEWEFIDRPGGDGGIDFNCKYTIDVKTASIENQDSTKAAINNLNLLVEHEKVRADIYVMCGYRERANCELMGWQWAQVVREYDHEKWPYYVDNHIIPAKELRPMIELQEGLKNAMRK